MKGLQNPFLTRSSEELGGYAEFLEQFDRTPLDILSDGGLIINKFIRSTPGGGKTTLLRLFTPAILYAVYSHRADEYRDLYSALHAIGAVSEDGPQLIGIRVSCANTYSDIADIGLPPKSSEIAFFRLLNARVLLGAIDGVGRLLETPSIEVVREVKYAISEDLRIPAGISRTGNLGDLIDWASIEEGSVCKMIDSFDSPETIDPLISVDQFFVLNLLAKISFTYLNRRLSLPFLAMLDDVQTLNRQQRKWLIDAILLGRYLTRAWISERLDALDLQAVVSAGDKPGRDIQEIRLEEHWQSPKGRHQFDSMLKNIADRRAKLFRERTITTFSARLDAGLEGKEHQGLYEKAISEIGTRIRARIEQGEKYKRWLAERNTTSKKPRDEAILWKSLEILISRDDKKAQQSFDFIASEPDEIDEDLNSRVRSAAELFISRDYSTPYYFGFETLVQLSSHNVDQFLLLAARLFSEIAALEFLHQGESRLLSPKRQHAILRATSEEWLESITKTVRYGRDIVAMISRLGTFCKETTYQDNAPYAPGVTGIGLLMGDWEALYEISNDKSHTYYRFTQTLRSAISNNLFDVRLDQRCKGNNWAILYLNRALCAQFQLPLGYGGWREWRLADLAKTLGEPKRRQADALGGA